MQVKSLADEEVPYNYSRKSKKILLINSHLFHLKAKSMIENTQIQASKK